MEEVPEVSAMVTIDLRHVKTAAEAEAAMKGGLQDVPTPSELKALSGGTGGDERKGVGLPYSSVPAPPPNPVKRYCGSKFPHDPHPYEGIGHGDPRYCPGKVG